MCTRGDALGDFIARLAAQPHPGSVELVINGDFVDFLAEEGPDGFSPFTAEPAAAAAKLREIAAREAPVFAALGKLLGAGHRLTILLGNHDIELSLPEVRAELLRLLGAGGAARLGALSFLYDGEGYAVGDALIEHGNRYDGFNVIDHDALRRVRSLQSRRQIVTEEDAFAPPAGSRLVCSVMNPIKKDYPFVDLLKPETEAVIPLLLALEPGYRKLLGQIASFLYEARKHEPVGARPVFRGEIGAFHAPAAGPVLRGDGAASRGAGPLIRGDISAAPPMAPPMAPPGAPRAPSPEEEGALVAALSAAMGSGEAAALLQDLDSEAPAPPAARGPAPAPAGVFRGDIGAVRSVAPAPSPWASALGFAQLLLGRRSELGRRLPALRRALRALKEDRTFDVGTEKATYLRAAQELADGGFRYVVFGHTHLRKDLALSPAWDGKARRYLNSGTWADLIRLPEAPLQDDDAAALAALEGFAEGLRRPDQYVFFQPSYVRLDVGEDGLVREAALCEHDGRDP